MNDVFVVHLNLAHSYGITLQQFYKSVQRVSMVQTCVLIAGTFDNSPESTNVISRSYGHDSGALEAYSNIFGMSVSDQSQMHNHVLRSKRIV